MTSSQRRTCAPRRRRRRRPTARAARRVRSLEPFASSSTVPVRCGRRRRRGRCRGCDRAYRRRRGRGASRPRSRPPRSRPPGNVSGSGSASAWRRLLSRRRRRPRRPRCRPDRGRACGCRPRPPRRQRRAGLSSASGVASHRARCSVVAIVRRLVAVDAWRSTMRRPGRPCAGGGSHRVRVLMRSVQVSERADIRAPSERRLTWCVSYESSVGVRPRWTAAGDFLSGRRSARDGSCRRARAADRTSVSPRSRHDREEVRRHRDVMHAQDVRAGIDAVAGSRRACRPARRGARP